MEHFQQQVTPVNTLVSVTCDRCGREVSAMDGFELDEMLRLKMTGGYGSVFGDMAQIKVDLCQHCLKEVLGPFMRIIPA